MKKGCKYTKKPQSTSRSEPIKLSGCDMITESMTIQGLRVIFWALIAIERWKVARPPLNNSSAADVWLTVFVFIVIIISVILLFRASASFRRIAKLTVTNEKLRQLKVGGGLASEK